MSTSLYERLGGRTRIEAISRDLVARHLVNPLIKQRFEKLSPEQIEVATRHVAEFFCAGSGGPEEYTGKDMLTTHKGMNINEQELIAAIDDVVAAMDAHGVGAQERSDVIAILYSLKGEVVRV